MGRAILGRRDVRLIVGAVGISALGDFLLWVPLTLHLQEMTGSGIAVPVLAAIAGLVLYRRPGEPEPTAAETAEPTIGEPVPALIDQ